MRREAMSSGGEASSFTLSMEEAQSSHVAMLQELGHRGAILGVPADLINLRLILVSGKTKEFLFSPNDSAADIAKHVYDNWPMDWEEEQVSSPNILRLIYQGRFLHGNVTLGALKLPFGKTTVMHLVARETLPEPNSQGQRNREKTGESNCCVIL
ncbi:PREDICTED: ubiquitin-like protein 3 [Nipponia nippon]|uniref:ubiquitin-like protein 3 n=1 Tax=Nipponia nippon TaxID=128390 RepID=UPI000510B14A|nr:PREDICTED: ubiquitin-like protein 3 [Nipponia nippon]